MGGSSDWSRGYSPLDLNPPFFQQPGGNGIPGLPNLGPPSLSVPTVGGPNNVSGTPLYGPGTAAGSAARDDIAFQAGMGSPDSPFNVDPVGRFNQYLQQMGSDYQAIMTERDRQVARSGSSAAAPYNRAIAALQAEITRVKEQQARFAEIGEQHEEAVTGIYDDTLTSLPGQQDEQTAFVDEAFGVVTKPSEFAIVSSPAVAEIAGDLAAVGVDEEIGDAVITVVAETEDEIMGYTDLVAQNTRNYVEQTSNILQKAMLAAQAEAGYDISSETEILNARLETQINNMLEEKKELQAKRAAAVSSARNATMAQFPEGLQYGAAGFKQATGQRFVSEMVSEGKVRPDEAPTLNTIIDWIHSSPIWDPKNNLRNYSNLRELFFPETVGMYDQGSVPPTEGMAAVAGSFGQTVPQYAQSYRLRQNPLDERTDILEMQSLIGHLSPVDRRSLMYVATQGARAIDEASNFYNTTVVGADPSSFEPGSILRSFATFEYELANGPFGQGPWEAWEYATSDRAHVGYTPSSPTEPTNTGFYSGVSGVY